MSGERLLVGHSESQECRVFAAGQVVGGEGEGGRGPKRRIRINSMKF